MSGEERERTSAFFDELRLGLEQNVTAWSMTPNAQHQRRRAAPSAAC
jgi:hypothetical protein